MRRAGASTAEETVDSAQRAVDSGCGMVAGTGTSFATVATKTVTVTLNAGSNSIKLFNDTAYAPDLDKVSVN